MNIKSFINAKMAVVLLLVLGALLVLSPAGLRKANTLSHAELVASITSQTAFVSAEDVATWLIDKRPDVLVVDLRPADEYGEYHLPGAINLPLASLFDAENLDQLSPDYQIVLYSNGSVYAAQAWVMLQQLGIDAYVMSGGLNYWAKAILHPEQPNDLAANPEVLQYQFRKAASGFFNGGGIDVSKDDASKQATPPVATPPKRPRRKKAEEGC
ncbi:MAG: rhodanese-like domain-containing protein [Calditrichia bacterium]|nr:rhodanese-like domain-containing protein [Calditrichota bacterium]MCB0268755.1 rhodanese-like domain-containing protein [Calditrichota bacterium]MCB0287016.1 rhodanese-like domain-containing protein [Calditrichota bacterium]MCB9067360.1 rhodanese-like domain-containing protein [Calditrichia bacterium]